MRVVLLLSMVLMLTGCGTVTDYDANTGSPSSLTGNQGGGGVQTSIWSNDPNKKTIANQHPVSP